MNNWLYGTYVYLRLQWRGGQGRGERGVDANSHTDTPVLMQAEEGISVSTGHEAEQWGGVSLQRHGAHGLVHLRIHEDYLSLVDDEEAVFVGRGEGDLATVHQRNTVLSTAGRTHPQHSTCTLHHHKTNSANVTAYIVQC